ncbi:MAG TPA: glycoside hydrolase family 2 TIM barrel-domain containing protein [Bryobacteraceae bacterium]|jgi:beta-galactosidase/beta-glucuronidase|nr:glycoside hydrolase family 2 TIM barrel-domain containing protein [Bryobacteraceae bacterium]
MHKRAALLLIACCALGAADIPRAEYPQPQFQREHWLSLNGVWQFEFDDANAGLDADWAAGDHKFNRNITVPYCFESRLSGIGDTSFHPWTWYRRSVVVPAEWKGRRVLLHFGAVNYWSMVWVNGKLAGSHEGGNTPFSFDVTRLLQPGANIVTVRAHFPPTDRDIPRGKQFWEPKSKSIFYTRTSGIWQTVWMEPVGVSYLDHVKITPALEGAVRLEFAIARPQPDLEITASAAFAGKPVASATSHASGAFATVRLSIDEPRLWSPASPNLYDVTLELRRGSEVLDRVQSYFGFRTVAAGHGRILLNGNSIFLKMVLDQGYWPESILTPPTDEAIQYDIRTAQAMGFNGARKHQKVEDPRYLYWADHLGFLVSGEMANAQEFDDAYVARFTHEWTAAVERDYNHPSIIIWAPINESWGVPNLRDVRQQNHLKSLYALTHSLDATRLVIDNEGWEHTGMTDLFAIHDYTRTGDLLYERYKNLGEPGAGVPDNAKVALLPGYRYNGQPVALTEFGGIAFIPAGHDVPPEAWGYSGVEKTADAALERLQGLYSAIARIPGFAGLCYTQLTDVEQEINGLMTYDRKPKFDVQKLREINALVH